ncbi:MAG: valine--tRNA ligase [Gemmatimonadota bacterium]|nr:valine--tRNA ligase [Gemmatimonadota bacterium]
MPDTRSLAPQFDPAAVETAVYQRWVDAGVFAPDDDADAEPYVIVIPPPNVTDRLHMGHGLNNTIQDLLIRFERMRGRKALWLPGTDHAGIATQNVVERLIAKEGKRRQDLGRDAFVERVWTYVHETGGTILEQLKAIGSSCDWGRTRFTLDETYSRAVRHVFVALYRDGLIYRGYRVIHWCPRCHTALSDEEAEFRDTEGKLYHVRYRIAGDAAEQKAGSTAEETAEETAGAAGGAEGAEGAARQGGSGADASAVPPFRRSAEWLTVATTRPETMFGDVAVVHHPEDERYAGLAGTMVEIPLSGVRIPVATSSVVERDFGTGLLKVTPAHDANDFEIARMIDPDGEMPGIMTADATMADVARVPADLRGLDRFEARRRIVEQLEAQGLLEKVEPHPHSIRHCYRCGTVVEPRLSDQWFVRMQPLADPALAAYRAGELTFVPERWGAVYEHWLTEIRDWNISRQLWWGHRIPAWYCDVEGCGHITVAETAPSTCERCGGAVRQDEDVLDTWFSSWLWPFATFGWPDATEDLARYYPGHTLVTAPDIIFFWVARMVMGGYHFLGKRPFDTVFLTGIVRDTQHRKMSKSLGNGIDPLEVVRGYGADALRYTVLTGAAIGTDVLLDPADLETSFAAGRNFANKLWNVGRFILTNLAPGTPDLSAVDPQTFELADRWILSRCQATIAETTVALERYRLNEAVGALYHFVWDELADWYVEQVKPRLYGDVPGGDVAPAVLAHVFGTVLRLLHPAMPFVTEELWGALPGTHEPVLAGARWPQADDGLRDEEADARFALVQDLVGAVRNIRAEYGVAPGRTVRTFVRPATLDTAEGCNAEQRTIERLARIETLTQGHAPSGVGAHAVLRDGSAVFVPLGDAIDVARECARLRDEVARIETQLAAVVRTLENERFLAKAPADVVARERAKESSWREQRATLAEKLRVLGC